MKKRNLIRLAVVLSVTSLAAYRLNGYMQPPAMNTQERITTVSAITVEPKPLTAWVFAEGTAEAQRKAFLNFERAGKVVAIGDDENHTSLREGSRVSGPKVPGEKGQHLASMDSRTTSATADSLAARLQSARQRSEEAKANTLRSHNDLNLAEIAFNRTEQLLKDGLISQDTLDRDRTALLNAQAAVSAATSAEASARAEIKSLSAELEGARVTLSKDSLFAPFDGLITVMNLREGNYYYPPAGVASNSDRESASAIVVVDDNRFEITLDIPEQSARMLQENQVAWVSANSNALYQSARASIPTDNIMVGKVWSVSPSISLANRSRRIKVRTNSHQPATIQDGLFVQVWIAARHKPDALTLPIESLSFRNTADTFRRR
ncbi:hypothetical protein [Parendozoicomonas sp. Alg238-R29]|uniref:efflux RND transporter periplasmic adaptor subunit n=1 Tax=Parendozoicomonas sp. Alg238-R29 TaxID=2993446 RepID=UPI00248DE9B9|nr:hypothetical protein [Parendozoicomonas sp. Alg238-R29]